MEPIRVDAKFTRVPPSTLAEFRRAAVRALEMTKREPGTLRYDWFFNDDQTFWIVREEYTDSAALLAHFGNLRDVYGELLQFGGGCSYEVFGSPPPEVREVLGSLDLAVFRQFQGE